VPVADLEAAGAGDAAAADRLVRGLFWPLVYELRPELWEKLAAAERIHPALLEAIPAPGNRILEVAAGSGRLTRHLVERAKEVVAVEPCDSLREILERRLPSVDVRAGTAERLPVDTGWADLTISCASLGPKQEVLAELERCTRPGGVIAYVSPETSEWFLTQGWNYREWDASEVVIPPHDPALEAFFGPLRPPHVLAWTTR
jgi:SAM-dependent methyltransferase